MEQDPFNPAPRKPFVQRIQEKLAASRFLTFSLLLHVVLVVMGGSVVLFKQYVAPPDFAPDGPLVGSETVVRPPEPEVVQVTEVLTQTQPNISAPTVSAIVSATTQTSSYQLVSAPMPIVKSLGEAKLGELPKATAAGIAKGLPAAMAGRAGGSARAAAMKASGGKDASEKAVMAGLRWLKQNQGADGSWGPGNAPAMTGLAVLCFLGHGETPEAPEFGPTVKKALDWLLKKGTEFDGRMSLTKNAFGNVYEHAIATYAMCEYYSMTKDERMADLIKKAVGHIVEGQAPDGGWQYGYAKGIDSDTSVSGWQIQALKAAHLTQLKIPGVDESLDKAMLNLKRVQGPKGGFGYRKAEDRYSLAGVGVLCTYFWKQDKDKVVKDGIEFLLKESEERHPVKYKSESGGGFRLYSWYYHTQACLMFGGSAWSKWNRTFQDEIASSQGPDGSWPPTGGKEDGEGLERQAGGSGPVYRTALCVLMLEVFYRYMPINK